MYPIDLACRLLKKNQYTLNRTIKRTVVETDELLVLCANCGNPMTHEPMTQILKAILIK